MTGKRNLPVVVRGNRIRDPRRIRIRVDDADRGDTLQPAFVQADVILERVQANHQIRLQRPVIRELLIHQPQVDVVVQLVHGPHAAAAQDLVPVRDRPGDPARKQVASLGHPRGVDDAACLSSARADEQDQPAVVRDALDDLGRAPQVGRRGLERDDVQALPDAVDVALVGGIPQTCGVPDVRLRGHKQLERDVSRRGRLRDELARFIEWSDDRSQLSRTASDALLGFMAPADVILGSTLC